MSFDASYLFPLKEEEFEFKCLSCSFQFENDKIKPFYLPCSDLVCEDCFEVAKRKDSYDCPSCRVNYSKVELQKIKHNKEISLLLRKNSCPLKKSILNLENNLKNGFLCQIHKKDIIINLFCFFHRVVLCSECILEHQYSQCIIKKFTESDLQFLINNFKLECVQIFDLNKNFTDNLSSLELKGNFQNNREIFNDYSEVIQTSQKLTNSFNKLKSFNFLEDYNYLNSSLQLEEYLNICEKLKSKTIITNSYCLKFLTNNFKIVTEYFFLEKTLANFHNVIIRSYNKLNEDSSYFVKYHGDYYKIENLNKEETKLILIENNLEFRRVYKSNDYIMKINSKDFKFYDIFLFDNLFQIVNCDYNFENNTKILYFNDTNFVFDFLQFFEVNNNNYLKISFKFEEKESVNNLYMKIVSSPSLVQFLVDFYVVDTNPMHFCKIEKFANLKKEGSFFKFFFIDQEFEIKNGKLCIYYDSGIYNGSIQSISYFKLNC